MIVYPDNWKKDYSGYSDYDIDIGPIVELVLKDAIRYINVNHLAYSGGIDSTVMLALLRQIYSKVHTYTISSRKDHPDAAFARLGSEKYETDHHEFIVEPTKVETDKFMGDNAVRQFFENVSEHTDKIITCDGVDEFMCGYYDHMDGTQETYERYLRQLTPNHLIPLNDASKDIRVYVPYLDRGMMYIYRNIPLDAKVDGTTRKKIMVKIAEYLEVPREIIERNKYGFCDAFREEDK
jgi:asparagine synthetase B (glutamine-hydrolysing)